MREAGIAGSIHSHRGDMQRRAERKRCSTITRGGDVSEPESAPPVLMLAFPRSARESEDEEEEEEERRQSASRGCTLQYQHATLQVFTQFHTTSSEGTDQVVTMLGPDWLVEVTDLVSDFMRVGDPRVAHLVDSSTLAGLEPGTTPFKVGKGSVQAQSGRPGNLGYPQIDSSGELRTFTSESHRSDPQETLFFPLPAVAPSKTKLFFHLLMTFSGKPQQPSEPSGGGEREGETLEQDLGL